MYYFLAPAARRARIYAAENSLTVKLKAQYRFVIENMATVRLTGDASGYTELSAPNAAGNNKLVLPTGNGANGQVLSTNGSGETSWVNAGKILQVVQATKLDTFSSSSTTGEDITGLSVTITPSSASSKILVMTDVKISGSSGGGGVLLLRGSTVIYQGDGSGSRAQYSNFSYGGTDTGIWYGDISASLNYLDSPASTSALTYKLQAKVASASYPIYINRTASDTGVYAVSLPSSIIVMEVAA